MPKQPAFSPTRFPRAWHLGIAASLMACGWYGINQAVSSDTQIDLPKEWLAAFTEQGLNVERTFDAEPGVTGIIFDYDPGRQILYLLKESNTLIEGPLYDLEGNSLSERHAMEQYLGDELAEAWDLLESRRDLWIANGDENASWHIYSFDDLNCGFCNRQYTELMPLVEAGRLQIRHLLVGIIGEDSEDLAIAALASSDPAASYHEYQLAFGSPESKTMLIDGSDGNTEEAGKILAQTTELMRKLGINGTPGVLFPPTPDNPYPTVSSGMQSPLSLMAHFEQPKEQSATD